MKNNMKNMRNLHSTINKKLILICILEAFMTTFVVGFAFYVIYHRNIEDEPGLIVLYALPMAIFLLVLIVFITTFVTRKLTNSIVEPVIDMAEHMEEVESHVAYEELLPFARKIKSHDAMRQEFTANVSHELKTPLTSISGYAQLMQAGVVKPEDYQIFSGKIITESDRLLALINDIIKLSQLDETSLEMLLDSELNTINLLDVAKDCIASLTPLADKKNITFSLISNPLETYNVRGDKGLLTELVYNLCDNAIRYNKEGGSIKVSLTKEYTGVARILNNCVENAFVVLSVRDTGIGIDEEHQPHVFERFYRVDKSHSRATGGTGLGLSIVKHIASIHKASIDLESEIGKGTEIEVHFPEYLE